MKKNALLLVEDDIFLRGLMKKKIEMEGYSVIEAENGKIALEKLRENEISLVLLDLIMPEVDGFEVLESVSKDPKLSKIPIIVLSNLGQKEKIDEAMALGAKDYIIKAHLTPSEIIEVIKKYLK